MTITRTCRTCQHWDTRNETYITARGITRTYAPCSVNAVEADAGPGCIALLGPDSHCQYHAQAWEPSDDYLAELADAQAYDDNPDRYNGVTAGVDYPVTL